MPDLPVLLWFRQDLRLSDHPALTSALKARAVIPVFIADRSAGSPWEMGAASACWLHHSLASLSEALERFGSRLILRKGSSEQVLKELLSETGAHKIFASRLYEPELAKRDRALQKILPLQLFEGALLFEPGEVLTGADTPYKVFTPFWRACLKHDFRLPLPAPEALPPVCSKIPSLPLAALELLPAIPWDTQIRATWQVGEASALDKLKIWLQSGLAGYAIERNRPDRQGTSRLSPHLHWGEISPAQVMYAAQQNMGGVPAEDLRVFLSEIGWREFAVHILDFFPDTDLNPLDSRFLDFPWAENTGLLKSWQRGQTGYPIVDAGMRELWATGWMHNRVRMIVASFLCKDLMIPWQEGARWFWDTLVDADLAANSLNWQWSAGSGADAAPYFRILNPLTQGQKFDPQGEYVRHWLPELAKLPTQWVHCPWAAPPIVLLEADLRLGKDYPFPLVDHRQARERALQAYQQIRNSSNP
ncbi:deoxyribodipyrimidine photolyase [bacterium (Candidatus Blackallbacteria) CG17_big_fil_post_rev_8_21_14_2_50_48_46]|uniref:Deoxyribodipyrimidine photo-lyase n=1 Tax=bacterium (Candidatus Blackallbacteria) CG17_big_fil_post_rev_8_21_14_2_50_48_46 TaxID=2014261 RepID=A0A2M7G5Y0_9BACT|nr:MAG: deoxyribodipyrimidine photolyase [bacterium (Candidatus Blackallbacteria) CG18_big_fil_WC_8_21_14_2_50_49_26]PIW17457.1 MAG: deoxyribodipyrimidine photolyase [bacterium (Candidatus Blackallbacteria) CG17_big_fil_post_rev_8_21_14_2_50_48_46]PIW48311.1 MAG: deoxyribodipyrimidine photolyase [bacterium (Candidatus Blackallbacteria) CG13_big_fil_rev_8_21_14_2_50_49_14]